MYPQDQQGNYDQTVSPGRSSILAGVIIGILASMLVGLVCGLIGYWLGYRSASSQNTPVKVDATPTPAVALSPTPTATPSPTPTPEIAGKYTGPTGELDISDVTEKSFTFDLSVGNTDGSGGIDGKAIRSTPATATFSQIIPDETVYNDPESVFYKKKCRMTFRFSGGKVKVSEDDYACSYWHGVKVDFNGTFAPAKKK